MAIARTILRNPPVLVLDEATSSLDTQTEAAVQAELERLAEGRTTITIAHRLSTIRDADQIAVLDHGKVVAAGSPEELKRSIPGAHVRLRFADVAGLDAAEHVLGGAFRHEDTLTLEVPSDAGATAKAAADVVLESTSSALQAGRAKVRQVTPAMKQAMGMALRRRKKSAKRKVVRKKKASRRKTKRRARR